MANDISSVKHWIAAGIWSTVGGLQFTWGMWFLLEGFTPLVWGVNFLAATISGVNVYQQHRKAHAAHELASELFWRPLPGRGTGGAELLVESAIEHAGYLEPGERPLDETVRDMGISVKEIRANLSKIYGRDI